MITLLVICIIYRGGLWVMKVKSPYLDKWWLYIFGPTILTLLFKLEGVKAVSDTICLLIGIVNGVFLALELRYYMKLHRRKSSRGI